MGRHGNTVWERIGGLEYDVAAHLVDALIATLATERLHQIGAAQIARNFHAGARTSSRTKCSRSDEVCGRSKKYAAVVA